MYAGKIRLQHAVTVANLGFSKEVSEKSSSELVEEQKKLV